MTAAFASALGDDSARPEFEIGKALSGAQNLLTLRPARQFYLAEAAAVALYALILAAGLNYTTRPQEAPEEQPMELVMETPPPPAVEEPKPPAPVVPPQPDAPPPPQAEAQPEPLPPPPAAVEPPVAPVKPPPPPPKPAAKPKPKPVAQKPAPAPARPAAAAPARAVPVPAGATPSAIANQIHARLARAAANAYPESQKPRSARISYRVMVDASGHVTSFSITPSGNAAFDSVASRLGGRIGTVDPPGRPAALSGVINFSYN
ncbi:energy transducer TonB [Rhodoblastus sp.]|uniref:energy transducer TonB n=1 Tax=Rhodoblastus sp. TaxID=1962975 RepID=UPI0035B41E28